MATLIIQLPNMPPVEHVLKEEAITIGRMKGNTIALDDDSVSLSHAKLTRKDGDYFLKDLNSTNGTMLNGQSVSETRLRDGDYVKFGEVTGRFHAYSTPPTAQTGAPAVLTAPAGAPPAPPPATSRQPVIASTLALPPTRRTMKTPKSFPLIPILTVAGGAALAGFLVWKFTFSGSNTLTVAPQPKPPTAQVPAKMLSPEKPPALAPKQQIPAAALASDNAAAEPSANQDLPSLIQSLKAGDPVERRRAAAALNSLASGAKDAVPALREAIKDSDSEVRMWAALSLINNRVYDKATIPILVQLLHHDNPILRQVACLSLALIPYEETEKEPVVTALTESANKDDNGEVRTAAVSALKIIVSETAPAGR